MVGWQGWPPSSEGSEATEGVESIALAGNVVGRCDGDWAGEVGCVWSLLLLLLCHGRAALGGRCVIAVVTAVDEGPRFCLLLLAFYG